MLGVIVRHQFTTHDAVVTADTLQAFAISLVPFSVYLYVMRAFYALQDTRTPFVLNTIENGMNVVLAIVLFPRLGVQGLALAWSGAYLVAAVGALAVLRRRIGGVPDATAMRSTVRAGVAAVALAVVAAQIASAIGHSSPAGALLATTVAATAGPPPFPPRPPPHSSAGTRPMKVLLNGRGGKVGSVLGPALETAGHELVDGLGSAEAMVDFTRPDAVVGNVEAALAAGVPCVVGTTGADLEGVGERARTAGLAVFFAPNFALGAVLMIRFAAEAARHLPNAEIVELHHDTKLDAPSGTAKATAAAMGGDPQIHSVRLPGLVAHQEVLLGGPGQLLTIRHDTLSREAFVPGVLLALERLRDLPPGLTVGLDALL